MTLTTTLDNMEQRLKDIVLRSSSSGEIHYPLEEQLYIIKEYIKEKKGYCPEFGIGKGFMEMQLLSMAFESSLLYFAAKIKEEDEQQK